MFFGRKREMILKGLTEDFFFFFRSFSDIIDSPKGEHYMTASNHLPANLMLSTHVFSSIYFQVFFL
jgi:hypothetical protein